MPAAVIPTSLTGSIYGSLPRGMPPRRVLVKRTLVVG